MVLGIIVDQLGRADDHRGMILGMLIGLVVGGAVAGMRGSGPCSQ
jgi:hypothetical protein